MQEQWKTQKVYREHDGFNLFGFSQEIRQNLLSLNFEERIEVEIIVDSESEGNLLDEGEPLTGLLIVSGELSYQREGAEDFTLTLGENLCTHRSDTFLVE